MQKMLYGDASKQSSKQYSSVGFTLLYQLFCRQGDGAMLQQVYKANC